MPSQQPPKQSPWTRFALNLGLVLILSISALFSGIYLNSEKAMERELKSRARALFSSIVVTRKWNAMHGGVYVEKKAGMESNPFLKNPDITATDGRVFTKKNPALMTREISLVAEQEGSFQFHITSLKPLNPKNAPDAFERESLQAFAQGAPETVTHEKSGSSTHYRYMAPLITERACLACHADQGYRLGDVRGGISIRFNIDEVENALFLNRLLIGLLFTVTAATLIGIVARLVFSLHRKLRAAEETIREMAVTDELTGLKNRRFIVGRLAAEVDRAYRYRRAISTILFDIDYFKRVNDSHGHDVGDAVLKAVSVAAQTQCRNTDLVGRYGGEEFLMLLPETGLDEAAKVAERLRRAIEALHTPDGKEGEVTVTASFGVATYTGNEGTSLPDIYAFIKRADTALYEAKKQGRNRVQTAQ